MKVRGTIGKLPMVVLLDSGITHNFLREELAKRLGLPIESTGHLDVWVANGETLASQGKFVGVSMILQGNSITADFYLLPMQGYDVVLGAQWLETLGPIMSRHGKGDSKVQGRFGCPTPCLRR
ncbi:hypothetical protein Pint_32862 [Pistacia integerrima]|uniref:Uncharacterized protein n=1 Tax=Pistacia integerrima TaxID=434235 RepID=A0ACC0X480_9ROSI|nr:hypothetical protein Pint_32862 [Pistacia integerrima]